MENTITAITGWRGSGKTLFMTALLYEYYRLGIKIYANYHLSFPFERITLKEVAEMPDYLRNAVVGLDEIQVGADAREIFKEGNKGITKLVTQLRKRHIAILYTTQKWKYPDKRLREQVNQQIHVEKTNIPGVMDLLFMDRTLSLTDMRIHANHKLFDGRPFFGLYNTDEIIEYSHD